MHLQTFVKAKKRMINLLCSEVYIHTVQLSSTMNLQIKDVNISAHATATQFILHLFVPLQLAALVDVSCGPAPRSIDLVGSCTRTRCALDCSFPVSSRLSSSPEVIRSIRQKRSYVIFSLTTESLL